ncbi:hypothetical protein SLA2020_194080 [Shorea laevis]
MQAKPIAQHQWLTKEEMTPQIFITIDDEELTTVVMLSSIVKAPEDEPTPESTEVKIPKISWLSKVNLPKFEGYRDDMGESLHHGNWFMDFEEPKAAQIGQFV